MNIQEILQEYREDNGLSYQEMATKAGVSKGEMWGLVNGKKNPRYATLILIQENLGIRLENPDNAIALAEENKRLRSQLKAIKQAIESAE